MMIMIMMIIMMIMVQNHHLVRSRIPRILGLFIMFLVCNTVPCFVSALRNDKNYRTNGDNQINNIDNIDAIDTIDVMDTNIYRIHSAKIVDVNGDYICNSSGDECMQIKERYYLSSAFVVVGRGVQKRWYVCTNDVARQSNHSVTETTKHPCHKVMGAIELSAKPFTTSTWKNLLSNQYDQTMIVQPLSYACPNIDVTAAMGLDKNAHLELLIEGSYDLWLKLFAMARNLTSSLGDVEYLAMENSSRYCVLQLLTLIQSRSLRLNTESVSDSTSEFNIVRCVDYGDCHSIRVGNPHDRHAIDMIALVTCERLAVFGWTDWSIQCYEQLLAIDNINWQPIVAERSILGCFVSRGVDWGHCVEQWGVVRYILLHLVTSTGAMNVTVVDALLTLQFSNEWVNLSRNSDSIPIALLDGMRSMVDFILVGNANGGSNNNLASEQAFAKLFCDYIEDPNSRSGSLKRIQPTFAFAYSFGTQNQNSYVSSSVFQRQLTSNSAVTNGKSKAGTPHELLSWSCSMMAVDFQVMLSTESPLSNGKHLGKTQEALDRTVSMLMNLLMIGDVEAAARRAHHTVMQLLSISSAELNETVATQYDSILHLIAIEGNLPSTAIAQCMHGSTNIRSAIRLYSTFVGGSGGVGDFERIKILVANSGYFASYLNTLLQLTSPVILESSSNCWQIEVTALRKIMTSVLQLLVSHCQESSFENRCKLHDEATTIGARGLFLLAYQGLSLPDIELRSTMLKHNPMKVDFAVPNLYFQLVSVVNAQIETVKMMDYKASAATLRVGFLSAFFFRHSVGRLLGQIILSLVANRASNGLEIHILSVNDAVASAQARSSDDLTSALREAITNVSPDYWHSLNGSPVQLSSTIQQLSLDVMVFGDVFMDSLTAHLAMNRLAPTQIAFWGHPFSTGYPSFDYFVTTDDFETKADRSDQFSEQLVRFSSLSFRMFRRSEQGDGSKIERLSDSQFLNWIVSMASNIAGQRANYRALYKHFAESELDSITKTRYQRLPVRLYGCYQSLMKMHPLFDDALASVLALDPHAIIVLSANKKQGSWQNSFRIRLGKRFAALGLRHEDIVHRLLFVEQMPQIDYDKLVCGMDVTLDPFPFGGGVTLTDSLLCDRPVPFVTSSQLQTVHRIGAGIVRAVAALNFSSNSIGEYSSLDQWPTSANDIAVDSSIHAVYNSRNIESTLLNSIAPAILAYGRASVHLATRNREYVGSIQGTSNTPHLHRVSEQLDNLLRNDQAVSSEWESFLWQSSRR